MTTFNVNYGILRLQSSIEYRIQPTENTEYGPFYLCIVPDIQIDKLLYLYIRNSILGICGFQVEILHTTFHVSFSMKIVFLSFF